MIFFLRLNGRRNKILHEGEDDELQRIHLRLENLVLKEPDTKR